MRRLFGRRKQNSESIPQEQQAESEYDEKINCIVIDNGSHTMRAGFAGANHGANIFFPSLIGTADSTTYIGDNAYSKLEMLSLKETLQPDGVTYNFDVMEEIYDYIFNSEMRLDTSEFSLIMTEMLFNPKTNREKLTQIMFEKYNVESFYLNNQCFFSLLNDNISTGIVVNCGHGKTRIAPIIDGILGENASILDVGGKTINEYLTTFYRDKGYLYEDKKQINWQKDIETIKRNHCLVAQDFENELAHFETKEFNNFNQDNIILDRECIQSCEILFNPTQLGIPAGISDSVFDIIENFSPDIKKTLFQNIILCGGCSELPGFKERIQQDITKSVPEATNVRVKGTHARSLAPWNGASLFACTNELRQQFLSKEDFNEGKLF